jgi:hypothetical protein
MVESETVNVYVEMLIDEIKKLAENNVVIVRILYRPSREHYNYKTGLMVIFKKKFLKFTEQDIRDIKTITISAGENQEYPIQIDRIIERSIGLDYVVESIAVF